MPRVTSHTKKKHCGVPPNSILDTPCKKQERNVVVPWKNKGEPYLSKQPGMLLPRPWPGVCGGSPRGGLFSMCYRPLTMGGSQILAPTYVVPQHDPCVMIDQIWTCHWVASQQQENIVLTVRLTVRFFYSVGIECLSSWLTWICYTTRVLMMDFKTCKTSTTIRPGLRGSGSCPNEHGTLLCWRHVSWYGLGWRGSAHWFPLSLASQAAC